MASSKLTLKNSGLYTSYNTLGSVPEGSMSEAENIVIDNKNLSEIRRGFKIFGDPMGTLTTNSAKQMVNYRNTILRHYEPDNDRGYLEYQDSPGSSTFSQYLGLRMEFATSLTTTGTEALFQTGVPHNLLLGDTVVIENSSVTGYNGIFEVTEIVSPTEFLYEVGSSLPPSSGNVVIFESTLNDIRQTENDVRIKSVEANGNLYLTTKNGIKKIDTVDATVVDAGVPRGLDISTELFDFPGFFTQDSQVGYRIVWGIKDANENLVLGPPSQRAFISNSGLDLFVQDYNTFISTLTGESSITGSYNTILASESLDEIKTTFNGNLNTLGAEVALTGNYSVNTITGIATIPVLQEAYNGTIDILEQETSITGTYELARTSQQTRLTIAIPPSITPSHFYQIYRTSNSIDLSVTPAEDYQLTYEANPTYEEIANGQLTIVDITPEGFRGADLYTNPNQEGESQANTAPPFAKDIELYNGMVFYANTRTKHKLKISLTGLDALVAGSSTLIVSRGSSTFTITFSNTAEDISTGTALLDTNPSNSVSQRIENIARSIVRVINRYSSNNILYSYYISTPDGVPGEILLESRDLNEVAFNVQATNSTTIIGNNTISSYTPALINPETSLNEVKENRLYYSKVQEPEAVPELNFINVGGGDNAIERIKALRDGVFIFTNEGIFRIFGDSPNSLTLVPFDNTVSIKAPDALAKGSNKIFIMSDDGIVQVSDGSVEVISYQIEDQITPLLDPKFTNFKKATFGDFYQSDRKFMFFTVSSPTDTVATQCFVYNVFTNTWVKWILSKTCSVINEFDDKLYLGASDTNFIEQERKDLDYTDHCDREYVVDILQVSKRITSILSNGSQVSITAENHGLSSNDVIKINNSNSTPSIDGNYKVTVLDQNTFNINTSISSNGNNGIWEVISSKNTVKTKVKLVTTANVNVGDVIVQTLTDTIDTVTYTYELESAISAVDDSTGLVTLDNDNVIFEIGEAINYENIPIKITWNPQYGDDPSVLKQFREIHVMFADFRGSDLDVEFSSDIETQKNRVTFDLNVFGNWGKFGWGKQSWGGNRNTKNLRSYIPTGKQRARQLEITFNHIRARETWKLEGVALFYKPIGVGERTNRG